MIAERGRVPDRQNKNAASQNIQFNSFFLFSYHEYVREELRRLRSELLRFRVFSQTKDVCKGLQIALPGEPGVQRTRLPPGAPHTGVHRDPRASPSRGYGPCFIHCHSPSAWHSAGHSDRTQYSFNQMFLLIHYNSPQSITFAHDKSRSRVKKS